MVKPVAHNAFQYKINAKKGEDTAEVLIYGDIGDSWYGESITAVKFVKELQALDVDYLDVRINSYGGSVSDGLAIYNALTRHKAAVAVHIDGVAMSIATLIAMGGDTVNIAANALFMVHAPWGAAIGNAQDMRDYADILDMYAEAMAASYVAKTGKDKADILALLTDGEDHYYSADEAVAEGFADAVTDAVAVAASLPRDRFHNLPAAAAAFIRNKESTMPKETNPAATDPKVVEIEQAAQAKALVEIKARNEKMAGLFTGILGNAKVKAEYEKIIADPTVTLEQATERLMAKLGEGVESCVPAGYTGPTLRGDIVDARDKRIEAMSQSMLARVGAAKHDGQNPFRGHRLHEIARACLESAGVNTKGMDMLDIAAKALHRGVVRGAQTTSDFDAILENTLHKLVLAGFNAVEPIYPRIAKIGDVTDFRDWRRMVPGLIGNLDSVNEAGEYLNKNIPDAEKNTIAASRHGNIIRVTPEVVVNDDMGYISGMANSLGMAGPRAIDRALITLLESNSGVGPTLSDSVALFHTNHGNYLASGSGTAPSVASLNVAATAMAAQTAPGDDAEPLDIVPDRTLVPTGLRATMYEVVNAEFNDDSQKNQRKPNSVRNMLSDIVATARLSVSTRWYLFANPMVAPSIEVVFLDGQREPKVTQQENFGSSALEVKVELPFGVGAIDYRGIYCNYGA